MSLSARSAFILPLVLAGPVYFETEVPQPPAEEWRWVGRAKSSELIELTFAVKQTNLNLLQDLVLAVSDPDSPSYGNHMSLEAVNELIAPSRASIRAVEDHLERHGIRGCDGSINQDFIMCVVPIRQAEAVLNATYHEFTHATTSNVSVLRAMRYSLPADVAAHVDFVAPTVRFPTVRPRYQLSPNSTSNRENTPASLRSLYRVGDVEATQGRQACTAFLEQYFLQTDLDSFWESYYPKAIQRTVKVLGPNKGSPGVEASLDIEYITSLGGGVPTEFWSFAGRAPDNPENEPFLKWMLQVGNTTDDAVPKVFSTSYGEGEFSVSSDYMNRINVEFQKTSARGISLLFATGDYGVSSQGTCPKSRFVGQWPAASAWVTGVGGTEGGDTSTPEHAWSGSSGGFSDRWARPSYQTDAIATYFKTVPKDKVPDSKYYNQTGAGFPDVSAQGNDFIVINNNQHVGVAGTSCSSPTFAGIVSLLNGLRLAKNKSTLGFLNPLFYKNAGAFMDITTGSNQAGTDCGPMGFTATKGWVLASHRT